MKTIILLSILMLSIQSIRAQQDDVKLLTSDETWYIETLAFPLGFAQDIDLKGNVDLRFPPGWPKQDNPNFWSYVWAWRITDSDGLTKSDLEKYVTIYFDGLLGLDNKKIINREITDKNNLKDESSLRKTIAKFELNKTEQAFIQYAGEVNTFDTRYTKKPITLNVQVEQYICKNSEKSTIVFRYSPKAFSHSVWKTLYETKLVSDYCK